jgi:hypothetical protein
MDMKTNYKDTILDPKAILKLSEKANNRRLVDVVAETQAEISFKAGIKLGRLIGISGIVSLIKSQPLTKPDKDSITQFSPFYTIDIDKLKEWSIND